MSHWPFAADILFGREANRKLQIAAMSAAAVDISQSSSVLPVLPPKVAMAALPFYHSPFRQSLIRFFINPTLDLEAIDLALHLFTS